MADDIKSEKNVSSQSKKVLSDNAKKIGGDIYKGIFITLITTLLGGSLTLVYKMIELEREEIVQQHEYKAEVFYDVLNAANYRSYYALRFNGAYNRYQHFKNKKNVSSELLKTLKSDVDKKYAEYDKMVIYWNEGRAKREALIKKYFGYEIFSEIRNEIYPQFLIIHKNINLMYYYNYEYEDEMDKPIRLVNSKIENLAEKMQENFGYDFMFSKILGSPFAENKTYTLDTNSNDK